MPCFIYMQVREFDFESSMCYSARKMQREVSYRTIVSAGKLTSIVVLIFFMGMFFMIDSLYAQWEKSGNVVLVGFLIPAFVLSMGFLLLLLHNCLSRICFQFREGSIRGWQQILHYKRAEWELPIEGYYFYLGCEYPRGGALFYTTKRDSLFHAASLSYTIYLRSSGERHRVYSTRTKENALHFLEQLKEAYPHMQEVNEAGFILQSPEERYPNEPVLLAALGKRLIWKFFGGAFCLSLASLFGVMLIVATLAAPSSDPMGLLPLYVGIAILGITLPLGYYCFRQFLRWRRLSS